MSALRLLMLSLLSCLSWVSVSCAQAVGLDLSACSEPPERDVRILAALELRGRLVERASADAPLQIVVRCADERAVLSSAQRGEPREIDLATVPPALRARLLALAIAELARAEGPALELASEPVLRSPEPSPREPPRTRPAIVRPPPPVRGFVAAGLSLQAAPAWGLAASLASLVRVYGPLAWTGALELGQTHREIDRGRLRLRSLGLRSGPALLLERARSLLYVGLALRLTLFDLRGQPSDRSTTQAQSFRTYLLGPELFLGVSLALSRHLLLAFEAQLAQQLRELKLDVEGGSRTTLSSWSAAAKILLGAQW